MIGMSKTASLLNILDRANDPNLALCHDLPDVLASIAQVFRGVIGGTS
jgi:hypothetical protein